MVPAAPIPHPWLLRCLAPLALLAAGSSFSVEVARQYASSPEPKSMNRPMELTNPRSRVSNVKMGPLGLSIDVTVFSSGQTHLPLEPRVENQGGAWLMRDLLGLEALELHPDANPRALAELSEWARSICDPEPRPLYLLGFEGVDPRVELGPAVRRGCPSFRPIWVHLRPPLRCSSVAPAIEPPAPDN